MLQFVIIKIVIQYKFWPNWRIERIVKLLHVLLNSSFHCCCFYFTSDCSTNDHCPRFYQTPTFVSRKLLHTQKYLTRSKNQAQNNSTTCRGRLKELSLGSHADFKSRSQWLPWSRSRRDDGGELFMEWQECQCGGQRQSFFASAAVFRPINLLCPKCWLSNSLSDASDQSS